MLLYRHAHSDTYILMLMMTLIFTGEHLLVYYCCSDGGVMYEVSQRHRHVIQQYEY